MKKLPNPPPDVPTCHPQKSILKHRTQEACTIHPPENSTAHPPAASAGAPAAGERCHRLKFDEANITETYHPENKDYGHMKVNEPVTPYESPRGSVDVTPEEAEARMLKPGDVYQALSTADGSSKARSSFDNNRTKHYNEYLNRAKPEEVNETRGKDQGPSHSGPNPPAGSSSNPGHSHSHSNHPGHSHPPGSSSHQGHRHSHSSPSHPGPPK